MKQTFFWKCIF
ncbi:polymorphic outer membrane protein, partial [Chlamydia psittaci 84-8471/1]